MDRDDALAYLNGTYARFREATGVATSDDYDGWQAALDDAFAAFGAAEATAETRPALVALLRYHALLRLQDAALGLVTTQLGTGSATVKKELSDLMEHVTAALEAAAARVAQLGYETAQGDEWSSGRIGLDYLEPSAAAWAS